MQRKSHKGSYGFVFRFFVRCPGRSLAKADNGKREKVGMFCEVSVFQLSQDQYYPNSLSLLILAMKEQMSYCVEVQHAMSDRAMPTAPSFTSSLAFAAEDMGQLGND